LFPKAQIGYPLFLPALRVWLKPAPSALFGVVVVGVIVGVVSLVVVSCRCCGGSSSTGVVIVAVGVFVVVAGQQPRPDSQVHLLRPWQTPGLGVHVPTREQVPQVLHCGCGVPASRLPKGIRPALFQARRTNSRDIECYNCRERAHYTRDAGRVDGPLGCRTPPQREGKTHLPTNISGRATGRGSARPSSWWRARWLSRSVLRSDVLWGCPRSVCSRCRWWSLATSVIPET
jgi:hypothetical protein